MKWLQENSKMRLWPISEKAAFAKDESGRKWRRQEAKEQCHFFEGYHDIWVLQGYCDGVSEKGVLCEAEVKLVGPFGTVGRGITNQRSAIKKERLLAQRMANKFLKGIDLRTPNKIKSLTREMKSGKHGKGIQRFVTSNSLRKVATEDRASILKDLLLIEKLKKKK